MPNDFDIYNDEPDEAEMRAKLYEFAEGHCLRCGVQMTLEEGQPTSICVDLVRPRASGGLRTWDNVQALCQTCTDWRAAALTRDV
jgi:5-methylcytosine-specific restriction endonuclease McrA